LISKSLTISRANLKLGVCALIFAIGTSFYLFLIGEDAAAVSGLFVMAVLTPIFLLSRMVKSIVLQIIVGISVFTQVIHVPMFIIRKDTYTEYGWNGVKDFYLQFQNLSKYILS